MLEVSQVRIAREDWALDYDFQLERGAILTLQGRSGAGKTTLLMLLAGFETPDRGDIRWQGRSLLPLAVAQRPVSMLFQDHNLFEHVSVWRNLGLGMGRQRTAAWEQALRDGAEALGIETLLARMPATLSGGQRQRVALLRTLLRPEPLVLLDEPFAELDPQTHALAGQWVRDTARAAGKTVLLVTHHAQDVALGDRNQVLGD
ncbi:MAG: ATP-binding cassette domain-containing protein [Thiothrix sp.]|nr:ATP-binding cassette domain-containing protein [Thiothrix sp.]